MSAALSLTAGCERGATDAGASTPAPSSGTVVVTARDLRPFEQAIEGTTVRFWMVPVEAGRVAVPPGSPAESAEVGAFYIAETETTWDLFDVFVYGLDRPEGAGESDAVTRPSKPYVPPDRGFGHAGFPAISMTHQSAQAFCDWLSEKTGRRYRLPTEDEWMLVAQRCGHTGAIDEHEWHSGNAGSQTRAVAQKSACATGVHDLFGNVAEWVVGVDGKPAVRGGAYNDPPELIGASTRRTQSPAWNMSDPQMPKSKWWLPDAPFVGFRVVCETEQGASDGADDPGR